MLFRRVAWLGVLGASLLAATSCGSDRLNACEVLPTADVARVLEVATVRATPPFTDGPLAICHFEVPDGQYGDPYIPQEAVSLALQDDESYADLQREDLPLRKQQQLVDLGVDRAVIETRSSDGYGSSGVSLVHGSRTASIDFYPLVGRETEADQERILRALAAVVVARWMDA